jgi:type IV secretory pathway VirD2 relaxase
MSEDGFELRPGRVRDRGGPRQPSSLVGQVMQAARKAGVTPLSRAGRRWGGTGHHGRGRSASLRPEQGPATRRVVIKARVVRHNGTRYRAAPLARHIGYLERDGVTRDGARGEMFDTQGDTADGEAFAARCEDDRHHFRFIVSPEDGIELADLRGFTRELMEDMTRDLGTRLDWVAVDHWNTDNPHVHLLVRGRCEDGQDLVIDRDYIRSGLRARAQERATIELGPRTERDIQRALDREVPAERWTGLDRQLRQAQDRDGFVDLRPDGTGAQRAQRALLIGRATTLERMGLAERFGPGQWRLADDADAVLRDLETRGDIIKTLHRAMRAQGRQPDPSRLVIYDQGVGIAEAGGVTGRLVERGLRDELSGTAYAIVEGVDGRTHHLSFTDIEAAGDSAAGSIVEQRQWRDARGRDHDRLAIASELNLGQQVKADGATWLDRQLVAREPPVLGNGFGQDVRDALAARADHLAGQGLAGRQGQGFVFARGLLDTLRRRELAAAARDLTALSGLAALPVQAGDPVAGVYRERVNLVSGRFAMIDNGLGFQLVPWQPALESRLGQTVSGIANARGGVDWSFARSRSLSL